MARQLVVLALFIIGIGVLCATQAPTAAKRPVRSRAKAAAKPQAAAKPTQSVKLPGPADEQSLGFGSTRDDVVRLMGKPTRIAKVEKREIWFYDLSTVSLAGGQKVVAWSTYNHPVPVNIGAAAAKAPKITLGSSATDLIAAFGTPTTVAMQGQHQVWYFGTRSYAVRNGKVVPEQVGGQLPKVTRGPSSSASASSTQQKCWCPL